MVNPVTNSSAITITTERPGKVNLKIIDIAGRDVSNQVVDCGRGPNTVLKDFSRLVSGSYFLIVTQDQNRIVKPFIKQ
ncbi:MAG: T9SS type A sorting domain-containing protein [Flavobacterium sp.]